MPIAFHCSSCGNLVQTPDAAAGKKGRCPFCSDVMQVPHASTVYVEPPPPAQAAPALPPIPVACPACGQMVLAPAEYAGETGTCPRCQGDIVIPIPYGHPAWVPPQRPASIFDEVAMTPVLQQGETPPAIFMGIDMTRRAKTPDEFREEMLRKVTEKVKGKPRNPVATVMCVVAAICGLLDAMLVLGVAILLAVGLIGALVMLIDAPWQEVVTVGFSAALIVGIPLCIGLFNLLGVSAIFKRDNWFLAVTPPWIGIIYKLVFLIILGDLQSWAQIPLAAFFFVNLTQIISLSIPEVHKDFEDD
jgi:hypothetical protein